MHVGIIGAGIIGLGAARELSRRGHRVTLIDPEPLSGATHAAAGMLAPVAEVTYDQHNLYPLMLASAQMYPEFVRGIETESGYQRTETFVVGADAADRTFLVQLAEFQRSLGLDCEVITTRSARAAEPNLGTAMSAAVRIPGDNQVDPRLLGRALLAALGLPLDVAPGGAAGRAGVVASSVASAMVGRTGHQQGAVVGVRGGFPAVRALSSASGDVELIVARAVRVKSTRRFATVEIESADPTGPTPQDAAGAPTESATDEAAVVIGTGAATAGAGPVMAPACPPSARTRGTSTGRKQGKTPPRRSDADLRKLGPSKVGLGVVMGAKQGEPVPRPTVLSTTRLRFDHILVANGLAARDLVDVPVRPVYGDVVRLRPPAVRGPLIERTIRGVVQGRPVYLVPRTDGSLVLGATSREDDQAGVSAEGVFQLLRDAHRLLPAVWECEVVEMTARARPASPDDVPIIDTLKANISVAAGFSRHGILLAPLGAALAADVVEGEPTLSLLGAGADIDAEAIRRAVSLDRFSAPGDAAGEAQISHAPPHESPNELQNEAPYKDPNDASEEALEDAWGDAVYGEVDGAGGSVGGSVMEDEASTDADPHGSAAVTDAVDADAHSAAAPAGGDRPSDGPMDGPMDGPLDTAEAVSTQPQ